MPQHMEKLQLKTLDTNNFKIITTLMKPGFSHPTSETTTMSGKFGNLRLEAFLAVNDSVVAEQHYLRTNCFAMDDDFPKLLGKRERYLNAKGKRAAVQIDLLALEPHWMLPLHSMALDRERFMRSVKLPGWSQKGDPKDLLMEARFRYLVEANRFVEGPGITVARADYVAFTQAHFKSIRTVHHEFELSDRSQGAFSMAFFDRIDQPEYSVWRQYNDGSISAVQVVGRFGSDVDLEASGMLTTDLRTYREFEVDRLSRTPLLDNPELIIKAAHSEDALKVSLRSFNVWAYGCNDEPKWRAS